MVAAVLSVRVWKAAREMRHRTVGNARSIFFLPVRLPRVMHAHNPPPQKTMARGFQPMQLERVQRFGLETEIEWFPRFPGSQ